VHAEAAGEDLPVASRSSGPAGAFLLVLLADRLGDREGDPPLGVGAGDRGGGGLLDRDAGLEPGPRTSEFDVKGLEGGDAGLEAGLPAGGVPAGLGGGVHPHDPVALH